MEDEVLYLDYAATAPVSNIVSRNYYDAINIFGNPASFHKEGEKAYQAIEKSKLNILQCLNHNEDWNILFTSGATESINTIFYSFNPELIITTDLEHHAVKAASSACVVSNGITRWIQINLFDIITNTPTYLDGILISYTRILISIIAVNNETGLIIPVDKVLSAKEYVHSKFPDAEIVVHLDFTQGFCKIPYDMTDIDCYSFSAHKIGFFKSFGGLIYKKGIVEKYIQKNPLIKGGMQQNGLRSGTENPTFVYLLNKLIEDHMNNLNNNYTKAQIIKTAFYQIIPEIVNKYNKAVELLFTSKNTDEYSPYIINFSILGIEGESLVSALGNKICISTGSACSEENLSGSEVIKNYYKNLGVQSEDILDTYANSAVRISYDSSLTINQIVEDFQPTFDEAVKNLAKASTYKKD